MKRLIAMLAVLTMVFACGCSSNTSDNAESGGMDNGMSENQNGSAMTDNNGNVGDDIRDGVDDMGDAVGQGINDTGDAIENGADRMDEALTGEQNQTQAEGAAVDPEN